MNSDKKIKSVMSPERSKSSITNKSREDSLKTAHRTQVKNEHKDTLESIPRSNRYKHIKSKIQTRPFVNKNVHEESSEILLNAADGDSIKSSSIDGSDMRISRKSLNPLFHKRTKDEDNSILTPLMIKEARKSGALNLSNKGLASVPNKVYHINEEDKTTNMDLDLLIANHESAWWNQVMLSELNLSNNMITQLSPDIENLSCLTTLTLNNNSLSEIPKELSKLEKITFLNLAHNKLKTFPKEIYTLPNLKHLNISYNSFQELHPDISDFHMLITLDVSHNILNALPNGIGFLVRLKEFLLTHNCIQILPADLVNMRALKKLDVSYNKLTEIPEDIGCLRKLEYLDLTHNNIRTLPEFEGCEDLYELYLGDNEIYNIPKEFCSKLPRLKTLDLHNNKLTILPSELALLQNLVRLDLSNNDINNLPSSLCTLAHLIILKIDGNPVKSIRRDIIQCGTSQILKTLRYRHETEATEPLSASSSLTDMGADGLNSTPRPKGKSDDSIFPDRYKLRKTHCLNVTMQGLTEIPEKIFLDARDENANIIDFSKNQLTHLPPGLAHMAPCASELIFANNRLVEIPTFIGQFERVTQLNLSCNQLKNLPKEVGILSTLRELNLSNNLFTEIPSCIYELGNLEIFLIRDNRVTQIDASEKGLGALKRLAVLNLGNNNITYVPPILGNLNNITSLELLGNPFRQPRHQILQKGTDAIMTYLRDRIPVTQSQ